VERGEIDEDTVIVDAASGNTGTTLAMLGAIMGFKVILVVSSNVSREKIDSIRAFGTEVVVVNDGFKEQDREAKRITREMSGFYVNRSFNMDNLETHYLTTGREIWEQTDGEITHWVTGIGTSGTFMGVAKYLRERKSSVKCIGVDPNWLYNT